MATAGGAVGVECDPERESAWLEWLLILFYDRQINACRPRNSSRWAITRLFTYQRVRMASGEHLAPLPVDFRSSQACSELESLLETGFGLLQAVWRLCRGHFVRGCAWGTATALLNAVAAAATVKLLRLLEVPSPEEDVAWSSVYATVALVMFTTIATLVANEHMMLEKAKTAVRVGGGLEALVMKCMLRSPTTTNSDKPPHLVMREMTAHVSTFLGVTLLPQLCSDNVGLIGQWIVLERMVARNVGTTIVLVSAVVNGFIGLFGVVHSRARSQWVERQSQTVRWLYEYIKWALPVKLYAWETKLLDRVLKARREEDVVRKRLLLVQMIRESCGWGSLFVNIGLVYTLCIWQRIEMTSTLVFAVPLFAHRLSLLHAFNLILRLPHLQASSKHLEAFFRCARVATVWQEATNEDSASTKRVVLALERVTVMRESKILFVNTSATVLDGELVILHGAAGSGKSSLLQVFLDQHPVKSGSVSRSNGLKVAYCAQEHWLQAMTIRENILFGLDFESIKYHAVLDACELLEDLCALSVGDQTIVGHQGANLSGGQKARVALARACYLDADLYLLDCTLDNVDPIVQLQVFEKCVRKLLRNKTVVLVTLNPELISSCWADHLWEIRDAQVHQTQGRGRQMQSRRVRFGSWSEQDTSGLEIPLAKHSTDQRNIYVNSNVLDVARTCDSNHLDGSPILNLVLFTSCRSTMTSCVAGLLVLVVGAFAAEVWWWMANHVINSTSVRAGLACSEIAVAAIVALVLSNLVISWVVAPFATNLFTDLASSVIDSPISFFESMKVGDLMHRLWRDVHDGDIHWQRFFHISAIALAMGFALIETLIMIKSISSTLEDWTTEVTAGAPMIRGLGKRQQERFSRGYEELLDFKNERQYASAIHNGYVHVRFGFFRGLCLVLFLVATLVIILEVIVVDLTLPIQLVWLDGGIVNTRTKLLSIQRILQVTNLAQEQKCQDNKVLSVATPCDWPSHGCIQFENVCFSYPSKLFTSIPVLRNVSFSIDCGSKVGLVGRTGSGKSSVAMALFRIHELTQGHILVDGTDIRQLSVRDLRRRLSIIPQSPVFYRCSVRSYLDPFDEFHDAELWMVLKKAGFWVSNSAQETTLETMVAEDGANWSVGERQLLSLARTLLRPSRVLVLDEAFSSLEPTRDDAVLQLIEREFALSTVILITHRMDQVLHFDRIMVMDGGRVVEMGSVEELLSNPDGKFFEIAVDTMRMLGFECTLRGGTFPRHKNVNEPQLSRLAEVIQAEIDEHLGVLDSFLRIHYLAWTDAIDVATYWALLEVVVGSHVGSFTVGLGLVTNFFLELLNKGKSRWSNAHAVTSRYVQDFIKWVLPVKLYAWEGKLRERIEIARVEEDGARAQAVRYCVNSSILIVFVGVILMFLMSRGAEMSISTVFTVASLVNVIRGKLPSVYSGVVMFGQARASMRVLDEYFKRDLDLFPSVQSPSTIVTRPTDVHSVNMCNAILSQDGNPLLFNVTLTIQQGDLVIVHGSVGAGKSILVRALLEDHFGHNGAPITKPRHWNAAYCPQEHWLQTLTIKDNIMFGSAWDNTKYMQVLDACGLNEDLQLLAEGDLTRVSPGGANLSGGQKARIALARACYADADMYVLDCTLDCVDPIVQLHVFNNCIRRLLRNKTVVLVTQNPELISSRSVDLLLEVSAMTVTEVRQNRRNLNEPSCRVREANYRVQSGKLCFDNVSSVSLVYTDAYPPTPKALNDAMTTATDTGLTNDQVDERRILMDIMTKSDPMWSILVYFVCGVVHCALIVCRDLWLANEVVGAVDRAVAIVYIALATASSISMLGFVMSVTKRLFEYSARQFHNVVTALVNAPMEFFVNEASGNKLPVLQKDLEDTDIVWGESIPCLFGTKGVIIAAMSILFASVDGLGACWLCLLLFMWWRLARDVFEFDAYDLCKKASSELDRWSTEILRGRSVVAVLRDPHVTRTVMTYAKMLDRAAKVEHCFVVHNYYRALRYALLYNGFLALFAWVWWRAACSPQMLGLVLYLVTNVPSKLVTLSGEITFCRVQLRSLGSVAQIIASAKESAAEQAAHTMSSDLLAPSWPSSGNVRFDKVYFDYPAQGVPSTLGLRNVSFSVSGGEKVGVLGRTGSGKSSLAMALFRIHELRRGSILVDNINIRSLTFRDLRSRLNIIPQASIFYRCSVRSYLDPFGELPDAELWLVLRKVGLTGTGSSHVKTLEDMMADDGANWSVGQRQLLSLARTLLRPSKVLILDEAFSSLEQARDDTMMALIKSEFATSTVFLITHRMDHVLHFDRIMVLDAGKVAELGTLEELSTNPDSKLFEFLETAPLTR
ncbi:TPA: hypothetical protein N0F65_003238 [Lagenidium giganteum]|uniref:ABC transporter domain-containing protein n=1 Tax=Lagenidium giganteum TaxID=4803 RepID=A0AAV2ZEV0_9STRA|nr:TPA: hypothetical protein N0F65_003238 [Lagenidium giganteum]